MALRFAILGVLTARPMTGYEIAKYFEDPVGFVWSAPQSQVYPELRRLEEGGLIEAELVKRGTRATKRRYSVTASGAEALHTWLAEPAPVPAERDTFRLRTVYMDMVPTDVARRQFQAHLAFYERRAEQWRERAAGFRERRSDLLVERLERTPPEQHAAVIAFKVLAFDGQVARAVAEVAWARAALDMIDELEASTGSERVGD